MKGWFLKLLHILGKKNSNISFKQKKTFLYIVI